MFSKPTVEDFLCISIFRLHHEGVLCAGWSGDWIWQNSGANDEVARIGCCSNGHSLCLNYKARHRGEEWEHIEETVLLSKTRPHFGGERFWFICPGCNKRCAKLFGGVYFRCRECHGVGYQSQLSDGKNRALAKVFKRRKQLGGFGGMEEPFPPKPKWMRWATYERLRQADKVDYQEVLNLEWVWLTSLRARMGE